MAESLLRGDQTRYCRPDPRDACRAQIATPLFRAGCSLVDMQRNASAGFLDDAAAAACGWGRLIPEPPERPSRRWGLCVMGGHAARLLSLRPWCVSLVSQVPAHFFLVLSRLPLPARPRGPRDSSCGFPFSDQAISLPVNKPMQTKTQESGALAAAVPNRLGTRMSVSVSVGAMALNNTPQGRMRSG